jgi:hypothetical protein
MTVKIIESELPVSAGEVSAIETTLGFKFPVEYRAFIIEHNGGTPIPSKFLYRRHGEDPQVASIAWFLAIYDGPHENFLKYFRAYKGRIPDATIPVARGPGGSLLLLGISGELENKVFYWTSELEPHDETATALEMLYFVSDSFLEFISLLGKI